MKLCQARRSAFSSESDGLFHVTYVMHAPGAPEYKLSSLHLVRNGNFTRQHTDISLYHSSIKKRMWRLGAQILVFLVYPHKGVATSRVESSRAWTHGPLFDLVLWWSQRLGLLDTRAYAHPLTHTDTHFLNLIRLIRMLCLAVYFFFLKEKKEKKRLAAIVTSCEKKNREHTKNCSAEQHSPCFIQLFTEDNPILTPDMGAHIKLHHIATCSKEL